MGIIFILIITDDEFRLLKQQNIEILGKVFREYGKDVYNFIIIKTNGNYHLTDDLLNDTFISAYESLSSLKTRKNLKSWLIKIAHRRLIDYYRKEFREKKYREIHAQLQTERENLTEELHKKQKATLFSMAFNRINTKYQAILKMKYEEGRKIKEIAADLKKSVSIIINTINRAKTALKREMKKVADNFF